MLRNRTVLLVALLSVIAVTLVTLPPATPGPTLAQPLHKPTLSDAGTDGPKQYQIKNVKCEDRTGFLCNNGNACGEATQTYCCASCINVDTFKSFCMSCGVEV